MLRYAIYPHAFGPSASVPAGEEGIINNRNIAISVEQIRQRGSIHFDWNDPWVEKEFSFLFCFCA